MQQKKYIKYNLNKSRSHLSRKLITLTTYNFLQQQHRIITQYNSCKPGLNFKTRHQFLRRKYNILNMKRL